MAERQAAAGPQTASRLKAQNRYLESIDAAAIAEAEQWASRKGPSWIKLPNVNVEASTDGLSGRFSRDQVALWLKLASNTEFGRKGIRTGESVGWYRILYSTVSDPRQTANVRVKWLHHIKDVRSGGVHLALFSSPPDFVFDTLANAAYLSPEIRQQLQILIRRKTSSGARDCYDPTTGIFI